MNVLLINPSNHFEVVGNNPVALEGSRGCSPPLGLLYLAGYLVKHSDATVQILDVQAEKMSWTELSVRIGNMHPGVIGITVMTHTLLDVCRTIEIAKIRAPDAKIVLGGPHVHLFPEETINLPGVDYLILGEGERAFTKLIERIMSKKPVDDVEGLVFQRGRKIVHTGSTELISDLDSLPFPARSLTDIHRYHSVLMPRKPATTLFTSRGCPFVCSFCDRPHLGKKFRARSSQSVLAEIEECRRLGIQDFLFYDDTFTVRRQRVMDICKGIIDSGMNIFFDIRARVDTVDDEMLRILKRAGCRGIHYGVEAGTEKILEVLKKGITLRQVEDVFRLTRQIGIRTLAYFMIGSPSETREDVLQTFRFAKKIDPDYLHLAILTPFPGTEIYRTGLASGVIQHDVWREFAQRPNLGFVPPFWSEQFNLEELNALLVQGYREFYRRPTYLVRRALDVRSPEEFARKARAGFRLLRMKRKDI